MPIHTYSETIAISAFSSSAGDGFPLTVFHGGAGPGDPKGDKAGLAQKSLRAVADQLRAGGRRAGEFSPFLEGETAPKTRAEIASLRAAMLLESDPLFNAGRGASLQEDGKARVSAGFMESSRRKFSAVMNVGEVLHPSEMAFYLQSRRFCVLDCLGAFDLARDLGIPRTNLVTPERFEQWAKMRRETLAGNPTSGRTGTIGCVSVSSTGELAAVTSTGGVGNETVGRVGDTPTVAGTYCSDQVAVSCTGYGEQIISLAVGPRIAVRVQEGAALKDALEKTLREADQAGYHLAAITVAIDRARSELHWAIGSTADYFVWCAVTPRGVTDFTLTA